MSLSRREAEIYYLLTTALDSDEEYLHEGEFTQSMRSFASDAAYDLRGIFTRMKYEGGAVLSEAEIELCVREISSPERIANGKSRKVLESLGEDGCFILARLARSDDWRMRLFAIETAATDKYRSGNYYMPICTLLGDALHLLADENETVRLAAVESARWMHCNKIFLEHNVGTNETHIVVRIYRAVLACLDDSSPEIREAAAKQLGEWAANVAREKKDDSLASPNDENIAVLKQS